MKKKPNKTIYLDSIDFISSDTGLKNFIIPNMTEFSSLRELLNYAFANTPKNSLESYAHIHNENSSQDVLIFQRLEDGSTKYFQFS